MRSGATALKSWRRPSGTGLDQSAIQIVSVRPAANDFHARFSATGKVYEYHLHLGDADPFTRPFSWEIHEAPGHAENEKGGGLPCGPARLQGLLGPQRADEPGEALDTVRELGGWRWRAGRRVRIVAEADGFLYKMVRSLAGALVAVGEGRLSPADIRRS
jgi:tRNA pseudouridine38-40 synthase